MGDRLRESLGLTVITDRGLARPREVVEVVEMALKAGARAIQLRDKAAGPRDLLHQGLRLRELTRDWDALLFLNDRFDVALAVEADGVHLGPHDLPVAAVRSVAPEGFLIGHSADDPEVARRAERDGADYIGCGAVFPTSTKKDAGEVIGVEGLARVAEAVRIPVVGMGGVRVEGTGAMAAGSGAAGVAVVGAVMASDDVEEAVRLLLTPFLSKGK